jgi:hypothetical protein
MSIAGQVASVQQQIDESCDRASRDPASVMLVAVSKTHPVERILEAIQAGVQHFGENRVEEAIHKLPAVRSQTDIRVVWHMIGHIQSRKARDVAPLFDLIHSVDSVRLAEKLNAALPAGDRRRVLLEVNVSGEAAKSGFAGADWSQNSAVRQQLVEDLQAIRALPGLEVAGLMTMAPIVDEMEAARPVFRSLRELRNALEQATGEALPELSMGMTDDFPVAIEEGATLVRIGRAIFGVRLV